MDLYEHQAKELFAKHGVPTLVGTVITEAEDARAIAAQSGQPVVIKAQVKVGGRGKAGGVRVASTPEQAVEHADGILGMDIKGHTVHKVLVDPACNIAEEYYLSFLLDRSNRSFLSMCSVQGGVDIEAVAANNPEDLARITVDPVTGMTPELARRIVTEGHLPDDVIDQAVEVVQKLYHVFDEEDATLVEVNPLVRTAEGDLYAVDGKVTLDDNSKDRHCDTYAEFYDPADSDPRELAAKEVGLNYVKLDGNVGIIGNGAGLVMSTLDVVAYAGEQYDNVKPANFLDIGGGASADVMEAGLRIILEDEQVEAVFINVFGGITSCVEVAQGILQALNNLGNDLTKPLVLRLDGNQVEEARRVLVEAHHPLITTAQDMDSGAATVAAIVADRIAARTAGEE